MVVIFIFILVLISPESVVPQTPPNNNQRVNEGASTSTELTEFEKCEIRNYVHDVVRLFIAEDVGGQNLTDMVNNRFHELQAFHDEIHSYYVLAEYGAQRINNRIRSDERRKFFHQVLQKTLIHIFERVCNNHIHNELWYMYDQEKNVIKAGENVILNPIPDQCLCEKYEEKRILSEPFNPPVIQRPSTTFQFFRNSTEMSMMEVSQYHIIPLTLISEFFQIWFSDKLEDIPQTEPNDCLFISIGRFRRAILKLLIVQGKNTPYASIFSNEEWHTLGSNSEFDLSLNFFTNLLRRGVGWLSGNIFLGPRNRGPFSPEFGRTEEELHLAIDRDALHIIDSTHFNILFVVFVKLKLYIQKAPGMSPFDRFTSGFTLYNSMTYLLSRFDVTPMNRENWEERYPSDQDIRNATEEARREIITQKYWAVKKRERRGPRSTSYYRYVANDILEKDQLKYQWSEFITNLMQNSINARSKNEPFSWSCDLSRLYIDYMLHRSDSSASYQENCIINFDEYLFSKISNSSDWYKCNNAINSTMSDWCQAWTRIKVEHYNDEVDFVSLEESDLSVNIKKSWSESYSQDVKIMMNWLSSEMGLKKCKKFEFKLFKLSPQMSTSDITSNLLNKLLCYLLTMAIDECNKLMSRKKENFINYKNSLEKIY